MMMMMMILRRRRRQQQQQQQQASILFTNNKKTCCSCFRHRRRRRGGGGGGRFFLRSRCRRLLWLLFLRLQTIIQTISTLLQVLLVLQLILLPQHVVVAVEQSFNKEAVKLIEHKLDQFLRRPNETLQFMLNYERNGLLLSLLSSDENDDNSLLLLGTPTIRDHFFQLAYILPQRPNIFIALEDGTLMGVSENGYDSFYREPGEGYEINNINIPIQHNQQQQQQQQHNNDHNSLNMMMSSQSSQLDDDISNNSNFTNNSTSNNNTSNSSSSLPWYWKYYNSCFDRMTGERKPCIVDSKEQDLYIECINNCSLIECTTTYNNNKTENENDDGSTTDKVNIPPNIVSTTTKTIKTYCPQYTIKSVLSPQNRNKTFGFIPRTYHCLDNKGVVTNNNNGGGSGCYYKDGITPVNQTTLVGDYAYCGNNKNNNNNDNDDHNDARRICNPFVGAYRSRDYDPRYRDWYITTKQKQRTLWTKPHATFSSEFTSFEIAYTVPLYTTTTYTPPPTTTTTTTTTTENNNNNSNSNSNSRVFRGVMGIDYELDEIADFLRETYNNNDDDDDDDTTTEDDGTAVAIFEWNDDDDDDIKYYNNEFYLIGASTGVSPVMNALNDQPDKPCPYEEGTIDFDLANCVPSRVKISNLMAISNNTMDIVLQRAFLKHQGMNFQHIGQLLGVNLNDDDAAAKTNKFYQTTIGRYDMIEGNLRWGYVVVSPGEIRDTGINVGDSEFALICIIASLGAVICLFFFEIFLNNRTKRSYVLSDWRFSCVFFLSSAAFNLSSFSLLGYNIDSSCLARMWLIHMLFVCTLSSLLAKVTRINILKWNANRGRRRVFTTFHTFLLMLVPISIEAIILLVFTLVSPPVATQTILNVGEKALFEDVVCSMGNNAFIITQGIFEGGLILIGVYLAFISRHMDSEFGEAKQLIFALCNIGLIVLLVSLFTFVGGASDASQKVLYAVGIFWGTVIGSCAFAMPRILAAKREDSQRRQGRTHSSFQHGQFQVGTSSVQVGSSVQIGSSSALFIAGRRDVAKPSELQSVDESSIECEPQQSNNNLGSNLTTTQQSREEECTPSIGNADDASVKSTGNDDDASVKSSTGIVNDDASVKSTVKFDASSGDILVPLKQ